MSIQSGLLSGLRAGLRSGLSPSYTADTTTLSVAIADSADPVSGLSNFNYTVVVTNTGTADAANVVMDVHLDATLTYVSGSGTGWTVSNLGSGHIQATRGTLAAGAAPTITITVTPVNADATLSTTADASADNAPVPATQDTETTAITGQATLTINSFTDSADPVITQDAYSYACAVRNTSAVNTASNVSAVITIPANATFVSASGTGWTCNNVAGVVTCTRASIATSTTSNTITVNVTAASAAETSSATASASANNAAGTGNTTQTTAIKLVTRDATATTKFFPANATEWSDFITCKGLTISSPNRAWGCQDASGNLAAAVGSTVLTASGTPNYSQAITGLTRVGVQGRDNTADMFTMASGTGPSPGTTSVTWLVVAKMPATPAATRTDFFGLNVSQATNEAKVQHLLTSGALAARCNGVVTNGTTSVSSTLDCFALIYDRTNSACISYGAASDKISTTYSSSVSDGPKGLARGCAAIFAYAAQWEGAGAEMTSTQVKALMTALGWGTPSWS